MQVKLALMLWLALVTCMTGCTSTLPSLPPPPAQSSMPTSARQTENAAYTIGPEDVLAITVYDQPDLSTHATVSLDGSFSYPLIGTVRAAGLSPQQLEKRMTEMFAKYLKTPQVTITVEQFKSQQVNVLGEVRTPGTYPLRRESTLLEVILQAGGATANAGGNVLVVRAAGGGQSAGKGADRGSKDGDITQVNLDEVLAGKPQSILMYSGDTIYVPEKGSVYVSGEVAHPGRYPMEKDTTVMKAITLAGGFTPFAAKNNVRVKRVVEGSPKDFQAKTDDMLQTGDVLVVPASLF